MKKIKISLLVIATSLAIGSCKKYVDKGLLDQFADNEYWKNENNVRLYNWEFYNLFPGYGNGSVTGDFYFTTFTDDQVSTSFQNFPTSAPASDGNWDWKYIRKANIMLERADKVPMPDEAKNHWKGVARFFRALKYYGLVKRFGDVPWIGHSLDISDSALVYKSRDPRTLVMDSILADINYAIDNLRTATQEKNMINKNIALALKSRVGLYEGTYRRYHPEFNLPNADVFLSASKDAGDKLMIAGYALASEYQSLYNSLDLSGNNEVLLYKQYLGGYLTHSVIGFLTSSTRMSGLSKTAVESYLCDDGLPIGLSPKYMGDNSIQNVRANRDKRLLKTIDTILVYDKHLVGGLSSSTGYKPIKFVPTVPTTLLAPLNETDAPIFWLAETLLNYAEAAAVLDDMGKYTVTQADLDKSINKLRARAGLPNLQLSGTQGTAVNGVPYTDPKKDADVTSLIWEIRRERRVELMMDGFRYDDLIRWKKGTNMDSQLNPDIFLGAKVPAADPASHNGAGYLTPYATSIKRTFDARNYLSPIPTSQLSLYPQGNLSQNPGWQ